MQFKIKPLACWHLTILLVILSGTGFAQFGRSVYWKPDGSGYWTIREGAIEEVSLPSNHHSIVVSRDKLVPSGSTAPLRFRQFAFAADRGKVLLFTNTKRVWRYNTMGDYWVYDLAAGSLIRLGSGLPAASLMFAKFSPDGSRVAYVSGHNLYVEELSTHQVSQLTFDGSRKLINGTFDWVYEEEFDCRDGFRWSPDGSQIAYWQIDAKNTKDYLMLNTTDSIYSRAIPVEYPVAGEAPSPFRIGVVNISTAKTRWMDIPTDPVLGSYLPRMEWAAGNNELIVQHLNRPQHESDILLCNVSTGNYQVVLTEKDSAWIDILPAWDEDYKMGGWDWLKGGRQFLWASERDGWRHLYSVSRDGKQQNLITQGAYDVMKINCIDEKGNLLYFTASPDNATQAYLYRTRLDGKGKPELLSPAAQKGTHGYEIAPGGRFALHSFSNHTTPEISQWISLPDNKSLDLGASPQLADRSAGPGEPVTEFFRIRTQDGVDMDGWMVKPVPFDSTKKYPVVFYVYSEPAAQTVKDEYGVSNNFLYNGNMAKDGYIYISLDNRGTPAPKGAAWRKSIYRHIGSVNIRDQAMAAREILQWPFVDSSRIAVWGWSGGGSATLNLLFQYPEIYKTGISIAAVGNELTYDNIYQERYMGLPQENRMDFVNGSPITHAKNLKGNLLYIHGTGDDNVHYANAEMLINELVKYNKTFQFMSYPNRSHSLSEGAGTRQHLANLYTNYLREHCPGGGR